jgi:hypothetical protein
MKCKRFRHKLTPATLRGRSILGRLPLASVKPCSGGPPHGQAERHRSTQRAASFREPTRTLRARRSHAPTRPAQTRSWASGVRARAPAWPVAIPRSSCAGKPPVATHRQAPRAHPLTSPSLYVTRRPAMQLRRRRSSFSNPWGRAAAGSGRSSKPVAHRSISQCRPVRPFAKDPPSRLGLGSVRVRSSASASMSGLLDRAAWTRQRTFITGQWRPTGSAPRRVRRSSRTLDRCPGNRVSSRNRATYSPPLAESRSFATA